MPDRRTGRWECNRSCRNLLGAVNEIERCVLDIGQQLEANHGSHRVDIIVEGHLDHGAAIGFSQKILVWVGSMAFCKSRLELFFDPAEEVLNPFAPVTETISLSLE